MLKNGMLLTNDINSLSFSWRRGCLSRGEILRDIIVDFNKGFSSDNSI